MSGFDPKGPSFYYQMFVENAAKQAALSGMRIDVSKRKRSGKFISKWHIHAVEDGVEVETDYEFLRWDDIIIHQHWPRGPFKLFALMLKTYGRHLRSGFLYRTFVNAWPTAICGAYPAVLLIAVISIIAAITVSITALVFGSLLLGFAVAVLTSLLAIKYLTPWLDQKLGVYWLVRIYHFIIPQAKKQTPQLDERLSIFADTLNKTASNGDYDEILIVAHSTGAQNAVSTIAQALDRSNDLETTPSTISLLTLGGSINMLSWQDEADWFRHQLEQVAKHRAINWVDFSAAQDGACFALFDPLENSGISREKHEKISPKLLSIKLFELYSKQRFKTIKRSWRIIHFQYLSAGEILGSYDFFAITCGNKTLSQRFFKRKTTKNFDRFVIKSLKKPFKN